MRDFISFSTNDGSDAINGNQLPYDTKQLLYCIKATENYITNCWNISPYIEPVIFQTTPVHRKKRFKDFCL